MSKKITIFNIWPNKNERITWQLQLFFKECRDEIFKDTIHSEIENTRNDEGKARGQEGKDQDALHFKYSLNCNIFSLS